MKKICWFFLIMILVLTSTSCRRETFDPMDARRTIEYMESYRDAEQLLITVKRNVSLWNFTRDMVIYVDDMKFAGIVNGGEVLFMVPTGRHTIQARFALLSRSNKITFESDIRNGFGFETNYFLRLRLRMVDRFFP